jgi:hypothetical protein
MNTWTMIGKDAYQSKVEGGFLHVMKLGAHCWSVTKNGRVIGSAATKDEAFALA